MRSGQWIRYSLTVAVMAAAWQNLVAQNPIAGTKAALLHEPPPYWAYAVNPPSEPSDTPKTPDTTLRHVPNSEAVFTTAQTQNLLKPPDWHPADHPAMPVIVADGRPPQVYACLLYTSDAADE